jgi:hypothetical protein
VGPFQSSKTKAAKAAFSLGWVVRLDIHQHADRSPPRQNAKAIVLDLVDPAWAGRRGSTAAVSMSLAGSSVIMRASSLARFSIAALMIYLQPG